ncbi:cupredoxin domain-containing protein [Candidatus Methylocalor cossyra]|uniref:Cupredoxin-like domain-containing protein n=1 Tax=Candidatus Methylocalor cossyra TaxID=3108543 RepID=A0ABP1C8X9_9GAMM
MQQSLRSVLVALTGFLWVASPVAGAAEDYTLTIKDHRFSPAELQVPAGRKIKLVVKNEDASPEEFESKSLRKEKIVPGNGQVVMPLGPLDPGSYDFYGEFHEATAQGRIVAK